MKNVKILTILSLALGLAIVGCSSSTGSSTSTNPGKSTTSVKPSTSAHTHTFDTTKWEKNETQHWHPATCEHTTAKGDAASHSFVASTTKQSKQPTCTEEGVKYEVCSVCGYEKETKLAKIAHNFKGEGTHTDGEAEPWKSLYSKCTMCQTECLAINAMTYTSLVNKSGNATNPKSGPDYTLKMNANGDVATYTFNVPATGFTGDLYLYGAVDYWKDGSTNNNARGLTSRKSGEGFNCSFTLNGAAVEITNTASYEESGLTDNDGSGRTPSDYSSMGFVKVGALTGVLAGENTLTYTREESYNLCIASICLVGTFTNYQAA